MAAFLADHDVCIFSTSGAGGAWAMPVRYRSRGLEVTCLLPRWADVAEFVAHDPSVLLVIVDAPAPAPRWLQIAGVARAVAGPDWAEWLPGWTSPAPPAELHLLLRVTPQRIELFDEGRGWGARETVEI
jgi:hypothetical protein